ncbi:MAG: cytochrome c [Gammaproteobacteria bacterium]|nr:cytochrome c [Gammaproteobacteria bacterium]
MVPFTMYMPEHGVSRQVRTDVLATVCLLIGLLLCQEALGEGITPGLGRVPSPSELANVSTHIYADGSGLPPGSGDGAQGEKIYTSRCASCHGGVGQGGSAMELVGDSALLATEFPDRGIAVYWPYAPILFEYIKRAMPPDKPYSFSDNELYSVTAHLLELNGLIEPGRRVDAAVLSGLRMPNKDNFRSGYIEPR